MSFIHRLPVLAGRMAPVLRRLSSRIIIPVSLILAAALAVHSGITASRQSRMLLEEMRGNASALVDGFANSMVKGMVMADYAEIERSILRAAEFPRFERIQVCEASGRVVADVIRGDGGVLNILNSSANLAPPPPAADEVVTEQGNSLILWKPIRAGSLLGWVRASYSTREIAEMRMAAWKSSLLLAIVLIAGSSGVLFLLLRFPLRAVRELASFARGLATIRGKEIVVPHGALEIEQLGEALNHASRELASAERQLIAERERLAVTLHSIIDGVITTDMLGTIVLMNRVAEELTGWPAVEAQGKRLTEVFRLIDGESRLPLVSPVQAVLAGVQRTARSQVVLLPKGGGERIIAESVAPIIDRRGETVGVVLVFNDVTERERQDSELRKLEDQLRQARRMEAVGRLSGGIAHDFNNILSAVIGYANILRLKISATDPLRAYVDRIIEASNRATNLTSSLLSFSRPQRLALRRQDLNEVVRGCAGMLKRLIREDIEFQVDLCSGPVEITADQGQVEQALISLVTNACDAMPGGGRLQITTEMQLSGAQGATAVLTVRDTGIGMDREAQERILAPAGAGQEGGGGISFAAEIIRKHGGTITVDSEPGKGTRVRILFPAGADTFDGDATQPSFFPPVGRETILLVEDDQAVRNVAKICLEEYGYRVLEAGTADEAVGICKNLAQAVDLLITDVILPRKDGKALSEEIRKMRPGIKVLFMSGYTVDIMAQKGLDAEEGQFIPKPIDFESLLYAVRGILEHQ